MDIKTTEERSHNMSKIRSSDTKPEKLIRSALFEKGYRFRLHRKDLPGSPDIVFPRKKAIIFIQGCFWHRHWCSRAKLPQSNIEFWDKKLNTNKIRDEKNKEALLKMGWRVLWVWQCSLTTMEKREKAVKQICDWLESSKTFEEIPQENKSSNNN